jgi:superfamily II DNA or RNA helicase
MTGKQHIHLYPYQSDMVNRIEKAFMSFQSVMVQMPTGTGKTHVIAAAAKEFVSKGQVVWMVAHRRELVTQIRNTLGLYLSKDVMKLVEVRSVQWLTRHIGETKAAAPSLIVIDEAHHALAKTYSFLMKAFPEAKKLGVTATPYRLSGEGFTDLFDELLVSKSIYDFMIDGRLSLYDYLTVKEDAEDLQLIKGSSKN